MCASHSDFTPSKESGKPQQLFPLLERVAIRQFDKALHPKREECHTTTITTPVLHWCWQIILRNRQIPEIVMILLPKVTLTFGFFSLSSLFPTSSFILPYFSACIMLFHVLLTIPIVAFTAPDDPSYQGEFFPFFYSFSLELDMFDWTSGIRVAYCVDAPIPDLISPFRRAMAKVVTKFCQNITACNLRKPWDYPLLK